MRTIVYIDGFNLYYRALRGTNHKWLDIAAMSRAVLPSSCVVTRVNYYTARVSGRTKPDAPKRQHAYLRALATLPDVVVHYGNFMVHQKWAGLVQPPEFRPSFTLPPEAAPDVAYVWKTEEKGSDVNFGAHLVRDAFKGAFDLAAVLTNDTDLLEPVRIVRDELHLPVTLLTPVAKPATSLARIASEVRHVQPYLGPCILPDLIQIPGKSDPEAGGVVAALCTLSGRVIERLCELAPGWDGNRLQELYVSWARTLEPALSEDARFLGWVKSYTKRKPAPSVWGGITRAGTAPSNFLISKQPACQISRSAENSQGNDCAERHVMVKTFGIVSNKANVTSEIARGTDSCTLR